MCKRRRLESAVRGKGQQWHKGVVFATVPGRYHIRTEKKMSYFADLEAYLREHSEYKVELAASEEGEVRFWLAQVVTRSGEFVSEFPMGLTSTGAFHALASLQRMVKGDLDAPLPTGMPLDSPALCLLRDTGIVALDVASVSSKGGFSVSCEVWYGNKQDKQSVRIVARKSTTEDAIIHACTDFLKYLSSRRTWDNIPKH